MIGERPNRKRPSSREPLRLTLLGGWTATVGSSRRVPLASRKAQALLAYLALHAGEPQPRRKLMTLLWGDCGEHLAGQSLRRALYLLRRALDPVTGALLVASADTLTARPEAIVVDVAEFEGLVRDGSPAALERAAGLYRGELLDGLAVESSGFEEWLRAERERLYELAVESLGKLLGHQERLDHHEAAIQTAVRLLTLDPTQEVVHRALMRLYARQGRRAAALRQYQVCVDVLRREFDGEPEAATTELYLGVLQGHAGAAEREKTGAAARATRRSRGPVLGEVPLVGRKAEVKTLLDVIASAWAGRGRVVVISGEAGIGKSRLVSELHTLARHRGADVLLARCHQTEQVLPFRPLIEAVRDAGLPGRVQTSASLSPLARAELPRLFGELGEAPDTRSTRPESRGALFEALGELLARAAERRPLVLAIEDVHWADDMTLRFVAFAARRMAGRLLLAITFREEDAVDVPTLDVVLGELQSEPAVVRLALTPLSEAETLELAEALGRRQSTRAAPRADGIWHASRGHPLMIVETMREVLERPASHADEIPLMPRRVRELIQTRLARLDEPVRHVIAVAATVGEPASFELLGRAGATSDRETAEALEQLVRRRILHTVGERFAFSHERIRRVAYDALAPARRRNLHRAVGEALEALHAGAGHELDDRLAHHFSQGAVVDKAIGYLRRFAETARHRHAVEEALRSIEQALALVDALPEATRERTRLELLLRKSFVLAMLMRYQEVVALLVPHRARVDAFDAPDIAGHYYFRLGMANLHLGELVEARKLVPRALDEGTRCGDRTIIGLSHYLLSLESHVSGQGFAAGAAHARRAIDVLEQVGEGHYRGWSYCMLAYHLFHLGQFGPALEAAAQPEILAERFREPRLKNLGWLVGLIHATRGEWDVAVRQCERSLEQVNEGLYRGAALCALGHAHAEGGAGDRAVAALEAGLAAIREFRSRPAQARFLAYLADAQLLNGDPERARKTALDALAISEELDYPVGRAWAERSLGRAAHATHDPGAEVHLRAALERFDALGCRFETARTRLDLAELLQRLGRCAEGAAAAASAAEEFAVLGTPRWEARAGLVRAALGG